MIQRPLEKKNIVRILIFETFIGATTPIEQVCGRKVEARNIFQILCSTLKLY